MGKAGFNVVDLFCGCGGLSLGFIEAGYKVILGVDNDSAALETFKANHNGAEACNIDLSDNSFLKKMYRAVKDEKIDVIIAGPPCQGFSLTGPRNFDDKRNVLYLAVITAVKKIKPKAFLIENVPGLAALYGGQVKDEIIRRLKEVGYNVTMDILCAADYGVPQLRKRVFFGGLEKSLGQFEFPSKTHSPDNYVTCADAISDLPGRESELGEEEDDYESSPLTSYQRKLRSNCRKLYNHIATNHTEIVKSVIKLVPEGGDYRDLPKGVGEHRQFNEAWTRYHGSRPSYTIDTGHRNHFHYRHNRVPTIRENARLQSFSDSFIFYGTKTQQNRQVGNAVPPLLGYHLARQILRYIK
ncbi:MAG: DNA cytosine methyltransferase [Candidatus Omnitrophica bacterium]|nr:DNA cytosine methyltransferase [Candidatus Omnitrophota bacterium]